MLRALILYLPFWLVCYECRLLFIKMGSVQNLWTDASDVLTQAGLLPPSWEDGTHKVLGSLALSPDPKGKDRDLGLWRLSLASVPGVPHASAPCLQAGLQASPSRSLRSLRQKLPELFSGTFLAKKRLPDLAH